MAKQPAHPLELSPNELVRQHDGYKFFGLKPTALKEAINNGTVPRPFAVTPGGRAKAWFGSQIIEHHRRLVEANAKATTGSKP